MIKFKLSEHSALGTNDYFVVDTSGKVGIGTTSPAYKLNVEDSASFFFMVLLMLQQVVYLDYALIIKQLQ